MHGFRGVLAYTLPEALWLARPDQRRHPGRLPDRGPGRAGRAGRGPPRRGGHHADGGLPDHLDLIEKAAAAAGASPGRCGCASTSTPGTTRWAAGAGRGAAVPVTPAEADALATDITERPGLLLAGLMAYEAQIAGVGDNPPGRPLYAQAIRMMQRKSAAELPGGAPHRRRGPRGDAAGVRQRRRHRLGAQDRGRASRHRDRRRVRAVPPDPVRQLPGFTGQPAALFALPVVRRPGPGWVTAAFGGYLAWQAERGPAAAAVPAGRAPAGQGGGRGRGADPADRPGRGQARGRRPGLAAARQGGRAVRAVQPAAPGRGRRVAATVPTYRGEGKSFG